MPTLLQPLKERKLFQWALAYLAGAWLVFQGIEVLAEPWNLSEAIQRTIHVLLGVGTLHGDPVDVDVDCAGALGKQARLDVRPVDRVLANVCVVLEHVRHGLELLLAERHDHPLHAIGFQVLA